MTTETVSIRHLIPDEGKVIKNKVTEEYYPEGLYLAKGELKTNYIEADISEMPVTEEQITPDEQAAAEAEISESEEQ